ncbi:hypothetical protein EVAR_73159_1 [Eumeta japonica]|uniref:Uncharacterized protein n=1 Tax=Eumeta variegata TaxID=151549 RepID=A0A4C1TNL4_EUMVA|nr:hypothetical protein EVAR_73159_1 [Eumeta japonica]
MVVGSVMDSFAAKDNSDEEDSPYTQYTSYHNTLKQQQQYSSEDYDDDDYDANESSSSSLSNWFSSWFAFNRRNKKIGSTTVAPIKQKAIKAASSWLPSWLSFGANDRISTDTASNEDYDEYDSKYYDIN